MKRILSIILLTVVSTVLFAQDGHIIYNEQSNYKMFGRDVLVRSDHANLDTLTSVYAGSFAYDTLNNVLVYYDGTSWVDVVSGGGTLDAAYDYSGAGLGRTITADNGAVKISGTDGILVTGTFGSGAASEWVGGGSEDVAMFFNPAKGAFRAGFTDDTFWNDANVGNFSFASGYNTKASGAASSAFGTDTEASGTYSIATGATSIASGDYSSAIGDGILSRSFSEVSVGMLNTDYTPTSTNTWSATDRIFVIGNGTSSGTRADALIITKDGNLTMPTTTGAFSTPVLTTTQRNALTPTAGMMIYNSTDNKHQGYDGSIWNDFY